MTVLQAGGLTVLRGAEVVLNAVDVSLAPGRRVGVIGPNGVGKSTLLGVLAGELPLDEGTITLTPSSATIGLLRQEPERSATETCAQLLARRTGVAQAGAALDAATEALAAAAPDADTIYSDALERWLSLGAADLESRIGTVWAELGLHERLLDQPTASLSGGEAARVGLAALLLSRYDIYLLDEPTNDLDLDGLDRLERWVTELRGPVALVSHDRTFLARSVTHVLELDEYTHRSSEYGGGWEAYLAERSRDQLHAQERYEGNQSQRRDLAERAQREREWASQGVSKARKSDESDKNIRAFKINQTEQLAGKAARTQRAMERLEVVERPHRPWELRLTIDSPGRSGDIVARLNAAVVTQGRFQLGPIELTIGFGERVALLGANGSGKTTLIDTMLGRHRPESGLASLGPSVVVGEVEQSRTQLDGDATLLRAFVDASSLTDPDARTLLAKFGLFADHLLRPSSSLSPGERTRGALALLMANGANLLVLDEPTNHLDLPAIEQLEAALDTFTGTVLLVTHDRSLLERIRLTRRITLAGGQIVRDEQV
ncbi:MAG: ABC-F family ATP-binding cassette domain-containing protein [Acidimicrobiales bacterium]